MNRSRKFLLIFWIGIFLLCACGTENSAAPTATIDVQALVQTGIAQTLSAVPSFPTDTPQPPTPTATSTSVLFNTPTYDWRPTKAPCLGMDWIADVTIPDNTHMPPGTQFVKTWRIMNTGSCDWTTSYQLVFDSGDQMGAQTYISLPKAVPSGTMVDVSVAMKAPATLGEVKGNWMMLSPEGVKFGSGEGVPIYVQIIVVDTLFAVTGVNISVNNASFTGPCPPGNTFTFTAAISASAPGVVSWQWAWSDGSSGPSGSTTFTSPGTKNVQGIWTVTTSMSGSASLNITDPNHQAFGPGGSFTMTCSP
jgi:hypothetical protein